MGLGNLINETEWNLDTEVNEVQSSYGRMIFKIKGFNERFVMVLIRHVERYLTKVGIDMGLDDKITYNVTVHNGQAIIASDLSLIHI